MEVTLINCNDKLLTQGINLENGDNEKLTNALLTVIPSLDSWTYLPYSDTLEIYYLDESINPDLSMFGEVVNNGGNE